MIYSDYIKKSILDQSIQEIVDTKNHKQKHWEQRDGEQTWKLSFRLVNKHC